MGGPEELAPPPATPPVPAFPPVLAFPPAPGPPPRPAPADVPAWSPDPLTPALAPAPPIEVPPKPPELEPPEFEPPELEPPELEPPEPAACAAPAEPALLFVPPFPLLERPPPPANPPAAPLLEQATEVAIRSATKRQSIASDLAETGSEVRRTSGGRMLRSQTTTYVSVHNMWQEVSDSSPIATLARASRSAFWRAIGRATHDELGRDHDPHWI